MYMGVKIGFKKKEIKRNKKKRIYVAIKGNVLNVVRCVSKDVLEYARIFSVIVGLEKEPWTGRSSNIRLFWPTLVRTLIPRS